MVKFCNEKKIIKMNRIESQLILILLICSIAADVDKTVISLTGFFKIRKKI